MWQTDRQTRYGEMRRNRRNHLAPQEWFCLTVQVHRIALTTTHSNYSISTRLAQRGMFYFSLQQLLELIKILLSYYQKVVKYLHTTVYTPLQQKYCQRLLWTTSRPCRMTSLTHVTWGHLTLTSWLVATCQGYAKVTGQTASQQSRQRGLSRLHCQSNRARRNILRRLYVVIRKIHEWMF